ncbi:MAG: hypothetical protein KKD69_05745 [Euryarchaeota archaeon]|nr:hypothetical protein [Euryarchaeota archaeon]MBU4491948.1 hypothetical protein [Euryarchaeota archaeon]
MELENTQWLSHNELEELQWKKLYALLLHAQNNVPYYHKLFKGHGIHVHKFQSPSDLSMIPVLSKSDIRNHQDELIADGCLKSGLRSDNTSGSTGENVYFYHDKNCRAYFLGNIFRNRKWIGVNIGDLEVMVWGSAFDLSAAKKISGRIKSFLGNLYYISAFNLNSTSMPFHIASLRRWKPSLITGYASALEVLAGYMIDHDIDDIQPSGIIASAEMLFQNQRELIEKAFGCKVYNRYGSREFATISHECERGNQHIIMERVYVEVANEKDMHEGVEPGELLITDLDNFGMPMIRYRIGDMGELEDPGKACPCGRGLSMFAGIQGRVFDIIKTPSGQLLPGTFWTILSRSVPGIIQFQIVQKQLDRIEINLRPAASFSKDNLSTFYKIIERHCGSDMSVSVNIVRDIPISKSGKFRYVISEVKG